MPIPQPRRLVAIGAGLGIVAVLLSAAVARRAGPKLPPRRMAKASAVLVTGCSSGIGAAVADKLVSKGFTVYGTVRQEKDYEAAEKRGIIPVTCDVAKPEDVEAAAESVHESLRRLREARASGAAGKAIRNLETQADGAGSLQLVGLVCNAGIFETEGAEDDARARLATMERVLRVNTLGLYHVSEAFLPLLRAGGGGGSGARLVLVGSYFGSFVPTVSAISYAASKHAVEAIADGLRRRLKPEGMAVSLVKPGNIVTNMSNRGGVEYGETDVSVVVKDVLHALRNDRPHPRYYPGTVVGWPSTFLCHLFGLLPDNWADLLL